MNRSINPLPPASFTPTPGNYKPLAPFRYWCQQVIPLVYDDSLSYYELLGKVIDFLNKTMEDVETLHVDVTNLHNAFELLQKYVNDYFSNLDVQEEINNKLDSLVLDGTLSELVKPIVLEFANPEIVTSTAQMTNKGKMYVLASTGALYQWDGTKWKNTGLTFGGLENINSAGFAQVLVNPSLFVNYVPNVSVTFPKSTVFFNKTNYNTVEQTVDYPAGATAAVILFDLATKTYQLKNFTALNEDNLPVIGYVWKNTIWVNGVPAAQIKINSALYNAGWGEATFITDTGVVTYDTETNVLKLPSASVIYYAGKSVATAGSPITLDLSTIPTSASAWLITLNPADFTVHAKEWANPGFTEPWPILGYVYRSNVWINGVPQSNISIDGENKPKNIAYFSTNTGYVTVDVANKTLTLPGSSFITVLNQTYAFGGQTVQLPEASSNAWVLSVNRKTLQVYGTSWLNFKNMDPIIGFIYANNCYINGLHAFQILSNNIASKQAFLACGNPGNGKPFIIIDTTAKTFRLTVNSFALYGGTSQSIAAQTINYNDSGTACWFAINYQGKIYSVAWNGTKIVNDKIIGCLFGVNAFILGVPSDKIQINGKHDTYGMGLVLPAPYHSIVYTRDTSLQFLNGGSVLWNGDKVNYSPHTVEIEGPQIAYYILFNTQSGSFFVSTWGAYNPTNFPIVGGIYADYVWLNGVAPNMIKGDANTPREGNFIPSNPDDYIVFNPFKKYVSVPVGQVGSITNNINTTGGKITIEDASAPVKIAITQTRGGVESSTVNQRLNGPVIATVFDHAISSSALKAVAYNKSVAFFGDSITAGTGAPIPYHVWVSRLCSLEALNYGVGSTGFIINYTGDIVAGNGVEGGGKTTAVTGNNTVQKVMEATDFDYCVMASGTNDWASNESLHDFEDAFTEALDYALSKTAHVLVLTPIHRINDSANGNGVPLEDFGKSMIAICKTKCVPCFNGFDIPLNPNIASSRSTFFSDNIHPNNLGQKMMGYYLAELVKKAFIG